MGADRRTAPALGARWVVFVLLALAGLVVPTGSAGPAAATVTDMGTLVPFFCGFDPSAGPAASSAQAVNAAGLVTGYSQYGSCDGAIEATLFEGGTLTGLGWLGLGFDSSGMAINSAGVVAGWSSLAGLGCPCHPVVVENGVMSDLGFLGPPTPNGLTGKAFGINDYALVVGSAQFGPNVSGEHAFVFDRHSGVVLDLGTLGGRDSYAYGVNNRGVVVGKTATATDGYHAFRWSVAHGMEDLGPGSANAINGKGWITGSRGSHAFLLRRGVFTDLGPETTSGNAINGHGTVVGDPAFAYDGQVVTDLNTLVVGSGWTLLTATGVNDVGQIVGQGLIGGKSHGYLATPG